MQNVLIEVNPRIRIPRTFKRFCGLMGAQNNRFTHRNTPLTCKLIALDHRVFAGFDGLLN